MFIGTFALRTYALWERRFIVWVPLLLLIAGRIAIDIVSHLYALSNLGNNQNDIIRQSYLSWLMSKLQLP